MTGRSAAVIGGGIGGLVAAGLLAREGVEVTLFEQSDRLGGKAQAFERDGVTLDLGPTLLTLPDVVRQTFEALDALDELPGFTELTEQCTYRFSDGAEFVVSSDGRRTRAAVAALHPDDGEGLDAFYAEAASLYALAGEPYLTEPSAGPLTLFDRAARKGLSRLPLGALLSTLDGMARRHFRSDKLRQFAGRFATYAGASPYRASAVFSLIAHVERAFGVHHVVGGMGALSSALGRVLERCGVDVRLRTRATLHREGSASPRVSTEGAGARRFDAVIVNEDPLAYLGRAREPLSLSGYVLLVELPTRVRVPHHTIVFAPDYRQEFDQLFAGVVPDAPTLYVCHPAATDPSMAPEGKSGLYLMVNAPALDAPREEARHAWGAHAARLRRYCLDTLAREFPDCRAADVTVRAERTPVDLAALGAPRGSIYGFLPHGRFGPFKRPRLTSPWPGVFFTGGGTHPGGGVPLVMRSGQLAAQLALNHLSSRARA